VHILEKMMCVDKMDERGGEGRKQRKQEGTVEERCFKGGENYERGVGSGRY